MTSLQRLDKPKVSLNRPKVSLNRPKVQLQRAKPIVEEDSTTINYINKSGAGGFILKPDDCTSERIHNFGKGDCVDIGICMTICYPALCDEAKDELYPIDKSIWGR